MKKLFFYFAFFSIFFNIEEINVEDGYQQYLLRVPVVLYQDKVLDEGIIGKTKIIKNYISS